MKKVVIIGGGFAGTRAANLLEKDFDVTLIDNKDYFEFTPGILRTLVEPEHAERIQAMHTTSLKSAKFIKADIHDIDEKNVLIKNKKIQFDYLIIATGSTYNAPIKAKNLVLSTRASILQTANQKLLHAKKIVIIGGGLVGVELAAEIATVYPRKEVTIVQAGSKILERQHEKAQKYAQNFLTKNGVRIVFNERVKTVKGKTCLTRQGTCLITDLAFVCTGIRPNSECLKKHFSQHINERNYVLVNQNLQMEGSANIFAAGDINNVLEEKTAQNADIHASIITENIRRLERNEELKSYAPAPRLMVISLGKWRGILTYKNITLTGLIPGLLKNFIEWKEMRKLH